MKSYLKNYKKILLDTNFYSQEAILNASHTFLDDFYIFIEYKPKKKNAIVYFKNKNTSSKDELKIFTDKFANELLYSSLRCSVSKSNKKIREYIIGRALYLSPLAVNNPLRNNIDFRKDPLCIASTWENKRKVKK